MTRETPPPEVTPLLGALRRVAGPASGAAMVAAAAHGLLAVAVAHLLAGLVDAVVFGGTAIPPSPASLSALAGLALARAAAAWGADRFGFRAAASVRRHLFRRLLDHVAAAGPVRLAGRPTGEVVAVMTEAVAAVEPHWRSWAPTVARVAVVPPVVLLVVLSADLYAFAILAVSLPLVIWFMVLAGMGAEEASRRQWTSLARLGGNLLDQVRGLGDLALLGASKRAVGAVGRAARDFGRDTMAVLRLAFLSALILEFFATVSIAGIAIAVGFRLMWGDLDFRTGFFVLLLAPEFFAPLREFGARRHGRIEALAALGTIAEVLAEPTTQREGLDRRDADRPPRLRLEGVRVVHPDGRVALDGFDLDVAAGEHVAIVGPSGAGKSTLFALLTRFVEPSAGRILIDGTPLADLDLDPWRRSIVHLPQAPHLFEASVADNVAMGRAPIDGDRDRALDEALAAAEAEAFVARLPQGRDTRLGERGVGISGGEAQRLALARAFFAPGALVLFDEPTAHLDAETERVVGAAIARLRRGRTAITIAHRLETIAAADRVVVLDAGRLVDVGTPGDVAARHGGLAAMLVRAGLAPPGGPDTREADA